MKWTKWVVLGALLTWAANSEYDLDYYNVYRLDAVFGWYRVGSTYDTEYGLDSYGVYCITAVDEDDNESEYSEPIMYDSENDDTDTDPTPGR